MKESPRRQEFRDKGYIVFRDLFGRSEVDQAVASIEATAPSIQRPSGLNTSRMLFFNNSFQRSETIRSILADPRIVSILTEIAGPDLWVRWDQTVAKEPGGEAFPWHQDNGYNQLKVEHFQLWLGRTQLTRQPRLLLELPEIRGGSALLMVCPESHKMGLLPHEKVGRHLVCGRKADRPQSIEANPGGVLVFSRLTMHTTTP